MERKKERKPLHRRFVDERFNALALPMLPLLGEGVDVEGGVETRRFVSKIYYSSPGGIESLSPAPSTNPPTLPPMAVATRPCVSSCSVSQEKFAHPQFRSRGRMDGRGNRNGQSRRRD